MLKLYQVIVWMDDQTPGVRASIWAEDSFAVKKMLLEEYGEDATFSIHNEEDAKRIRS